MADMEKVIKGLEEVSDYFFDIYRNETDSYKCAKAQEYSDVAIDAIALLKDYRQHLQNDLETLKEEKMKLEFEHEAKAFMYKEKEGLMTIKII